MKIPAKFDSARTLVYLTATVHLNGQTLKIPFLIDTGSSVTTISFRHAEYLGVDLSNLNERIEPSLTYAGHIRTLKLGRVDFIVTEEEGRFLLEHLESVDVLPSTGDEDLDDSLPSTIGMDFLKECSYSLYICPKMNEAFFEKC